VFQPVSHVMEMTNHAAQEHQWLNDIVDTVVTIATRGYFVSPLFIFYRLHGITGWAVALTV